MMALGMVLGPSAGFADLVVGAVIGSFFLLCCGGFRMAGRRGWARRPLHVAYWLVLLYAVELVVVSALLLANGGLWYALGVAGLVGAAALAVSGPGLWRFYDEAEARRLSAQDCL
jgi:hypothetical protein